VGCGPPPPRHLLCTHHRPIRRPAHPSFGGIRADGLSRHIASNRANQYFRPVARLASFLLAATLLAPAGSAAASPRTAIFFYPWYGTPAVDGDFQHWQRGTAAEGVISSAYYPARGLYSSADALVLGAQMNEIAAAGVEQVVTSWWGWGSAEDRRLPAVLRAARAAQLDVAIHLEPYPDRTPASAQADIEHLRELGIRDFYLYAPNQDGLPWDWKAMNEALRGVRIFVQTGRVGYAKQWGFDGLYTYDILSYGATSFARLCGQARREGVLCAPSVGPGYDARRAGDDERVKPRRGGATYDAMWRAAIRARPNLVSITSYNEWEEGSQIEPARARGGYESYQGAWGLVGKPAERAYLDRTAYWSARFAAGTPRSKGRSALAAKPLSARIR
jgi:glycoprotein endo-alpha-1,2-mannosidase